MRADILIRHIFLKRNAFQLFSQHFLFFCISFLSFLHKIKYTLLNSIPTQPNETKKNPHTETTIIKKIVNAWELYIIMFPGTAATKTTTSPPHSASSPHALPTSTTTLLIDCKLVIRNPRSYASPSVSSVPPSPFPAHKTIRPRGNAILAESFRLSRRLRQFPYKSKR